MVIQHILRWGVADKLEVLLLGSTNCSYIHSYIAFWIISAYFTSSQKSVCQKSGGKKWEHRVDFPDASGGDLRKLPSWNVVLMEVRRWYRLTTEGSVSKKRSEKTRGWEIFEDGGKNEKNIGTAELKWNVFWMILNVCVGGFGVDLQNYEGFHCNQSCFEGSNGGLRCYSMKYNHLLSWSFNVKWWIELHPEMKHFPTIQRLWISQSMAGNRSSVTLTKRFTSYFGHVQRMICE